MALPRITAHCLVFAALAACSSSMTGGDSGTTVGGGGPGLPWNSDVRRFVLPDGTAAMVAVVPGATTVELLRRDTSGFIASPLPRPSSCSNPSPTALEALDLNGDGLDDVAVIDAGCGNWAALAHRDGTFSAQPLDGLMGALPGVRHIDAVDVDGDGDRDLLLGTIYRVVLVEQQGPGRWSRPVVHEFGLPQVAPMITRPFAMWSTDEAMPQHQVIVQRGDFLDALPLGPTSDSLTFLPAARVMSSGGASRPTAFDQWIEVPALARCGVDAIAAQVLDPNVGERSARALVALSLRATTYDATPWLPGIDVLAFAVHPATDVDARLVSVLGQRDGRTGLWVLRTRACAAPEVLAASDVDFEWQTLRLAINNGAPLAQRRALRVVGSGGETDGISVLHYDGFTVRQFIATAATQWRATGASFPIHAMRPDVGG